jgi:hypothetical protein
LARSLSAAGRRVSPPQQNPVSAPRALWVLRVLTHLDGELCEYTGVRAEEEVDARRRPSAARAERPEQRAVEQPLRQRGYI